MKEHQRPASKNQSFVSKHQYHIQDFGLEPDELQELISSIPIVLPKGCVKQDLSHQKIQPQGKVFLLWTTFIYN